MNEDRELPLVQMPKGTCPRRLKPGQVKRMLTTGKLIGYAIACPSCGFIENHPDLGAVEFQEEEERLIGALHPPSCAMCHRQLRIGRGVIAAVTLPA